MYFYILIYIYKYFFKKQAKKNSATPLISGWCAVISTLYNLQSLFKIERDLWCGSMMWQRRILPHVIMSLQLLSGVLGCIGLGSGLHPQILQSISKGPSQLFWSYLIKSSGFAVVFNSRSTSNNWSKTILDSFSIIKSFASIWGTIGHVFAYRNHRKYCNPRLSKGIAQALEDD